MRRDEHPLPRLWRLAVASAMTAMLLCALGMHGARAAAPSRLALEVFINDQPTGLIGEIFRAGDGRLMARRGELAQLGLAAPGKGAPDEMVAFDALPGLALLYEETTQKLHLSVPESLRLAKHYDLSARSARADAIRDAVSRDIGLVVNYSAYGSAARGYASTSRPYTTGTLTLDSRAFSPYGVFQNTSILGTSLVKGGALRLETAYVFAHRESAITTTAGDAISGGLNWTRPVRFGGVQVARSFGLRPDLVTAPMPSVAGSAAVPSTVDVFVDNMRIASQEVGAGPYRLTNLPVSGESGTARVVVRDVTGKETTTSLPFFTSSRLLAPGTSDFSLDAGFPRLRYALESFNYARRPMGQGSLRYGLTDAITLESHAEGTARLALAGGGASLSAGRFGIVSLAGAASWNAGRWGSMGYASWQGSFKGFFLGASTQRTFGRYLDVAAQSATIGTGRLPTNLLDSGFYILNRSARMARAIDRFSLGKSLEPINASVTANFVNVERGPGDVSRLASLTWSQNVARKYNTNVTVFSDFGTTRQSGILFGVSFMLGESILVNATGGGGRSDRSGTIDIARPMGEKAYDYAWRVYDTESRAASRGAQAAVRTPYARVGGGVRQDSATLGGFGEAEGALIATPSGVFASRRVQDAFAVVDVGVPGVEVLHENRPVGRTNSTGKLVVSEVTSLQPSKISIAPETLPGQSHASITEAEIVPGFRGVSTVNIATVVAQDTARLEIRDGAGRPMPPGTRIAHDESGQSYTIGYGGLTFLPRISDENTLRIEDGTKSCSLRFARTERRDELGHVGPLTCVLQ